MLAVAGIISFTRADDRLKIGDSAPAFTLKDADGMEHRLADYTGKIVVLYFYPRNDTPGCTAEACNLRDNWSVLKEKNVVVLGVSYDSADSHKSFRSKYNLPFTILSDADKKVSKLYGADGLIMAKRITFLIGSEGKIIGIIDKVKTKDHAAQILEILEQTI